MDDSNFSILAVWGLLGHSSCTRGISTHSRHALGSANQRTLANNLGLVRDCTFGRPIRHMATLPHAPLEGLTVTVRVDRVSVCGA